MMANANGEISNDKLIDLRVVDLRNELEKRGLDKSGVKAVLLERLEQALKTEGGNLENTEGIKETSDTVPSNLTDLEKNEVLSEDKFQEESEPTDVLQNELTTDNMDEKEAETSNEALADVSLNITNPDTDSLLPGKAYVEGLSDDQLLSSDTKPSDMLGNDTFDKDQFVEELPTTTLNTNKDTDTIQQGESDDPLKDTTAPPEEASSSAEMNPKEEKNELSSSAENNTKDENSEISSSAENNSKEENSEKKSSPANVKNTTPPQKCNELKGDKVAKTAPSDSLPPTPISVPRKAPFALKDTSCMDTSTTQQSEENESLIVHVDDTQNDLDADLVASKDKVSGKTEVKKVDGSTVEERAKGKTEGGQTEKKADEKKDVKLKSSSVSKPKVIKNIKSNDQNSRNLWVSGLATNTRATDLKLLFSKYSKVIGAKVVTNARSPGARCYGFVTMSNAHGASKCIQHLNQTELHGRMISVERARKEPTQIKPPETKSGEKKVEKAELKKDEKKDGDKKDVEKKEPKKDDKSKSDDRRRTSSSHRSSDKSRVTTSSSNTAKTSLKPATKEGSEESAKPASSLAAAGTKEKVSSTLKPKPRGPSSSSVKKDILSFDQIIMEREQQQQRSRHRQRNRRKQEKRRSKILGLAHVIQQKQQEENIRLDKVREKIRSEKMKLEKMKLEKEKMLKYRMEKELLKIERRRVEMRCAEMLRLEEMRQSAKRPRDRSSLHDVELWDEPKRSRIGSSSNLSRFEHPFQNESHYNEYEHTDYGRRVEHYDRRDSRTLEGGSRYDERKEREMMRREMGPFRDIRARDERRADDHSRTDGKLNRMPFELGRDMGPSGEPDRRYIGHDRGHDNDRRNISAHDRLGLLGNSLVGGPDQRPPWGSGSIDGKVDNWSHMHGDIDSRGMNRSNKPWNGNPMDKTGRDASGAFVDSSRPGNSGGMGQNMGPGNMFGNSQSHSGIMMVTHEGGGGGGSNMSGRMQEPRFDAYNIMG